MKLTQPNQQQELHAVTPIEMGVSYGFRKKERVYEETNQLSFYCCVVLDILEGTLDDNHGTKQHHLLHQVLVKQKDCPKEGETWKNVSTLKKRFPTFIFQEKIIL